MKRLAPVEQGLGAVRAALASGSAAESNAAVVLKVGYGCGLPSFSLYILV